MTKIPNNLPLPSSLRFVGVTSIDIDVDDQTISASFTAEAAPGFPVELDYSFNPETDHELADALTALTTIIAKRIHEPIHVERELKCDRCTAACCTQYPQIVLYAQDVPGLLEATGLPHEQALREAKIIVGHGSGSVIGYLGRIDAEGIDGVEDESACGFLTWTKQGVGRCSIYQHRPYTCRGYTEHDCEERRDPVPALYKIRPRDGAKTLFDTHPHFDLDRYNAEG